MSYKYSKESIINDGIKYLKNYGHKNINKENIFTDTTYSQMFEKMLKNNKGKSNDLDNIIDEILKLFKVNVFIE